MRPVYNLILSGRPTVDERAPRAGLRFGYVADRCAAVPLGFPPICAPLVTRVSGWYRGRVRVQVRRTCAGGLLKKGAAITRSPGRYAPVATAHGAPVDVAHGAGRLVL